MIRLSRFIPKFDFTKRQKFLLATIIVTLSMMAIRFDVFSVAAWRFRVLGFSLISIGATVLSLKDEDFSGVEWLTLPILPVFFALAAALVFPLLPSEVSQLFFWSLDTDTGIVIAGIIRFAYLAFFATGFYAVLLTANIFNIAGIKSIQLTRVAHSVGFFLTLTTMLLLNLVIYSLHLPSFINFILIFVIAFPLTLQSIWSFLLEPKLTRVVVTLSFAVSLAVAQVGWILSFYPITIFIFALFLTALLYEMIGMVQYYLSERLTLVLVREAVFVMSIFLILTVLSASWTG